MKVLPDPDVDVYDAAFAAVHSARVLTQLLPHWRQHDHQEAARRWLARATRADEERRAARSRAVEDYRELYGEPPDAPTLDDLIREPEVRAQRRMERAHQLAELHWRASGQHRPLIRRSHAS